MSYADEGYATRREYLESLAEDYGVEIGTVRLLADILGPDEDFDYLVTALDNMSMEQ